MTYQAPEKSQSRKWISEPHSGAVARGPEPGPYRAAGATCSQQRMLVLTASAASWCLPGDGLLRVIGREAELATGQNADRLRVLHHGHG